MVFLAFVTLAIVFFIGINAASAKVTLIALREGSWRGPRWL
jgi:hypothetical protein